MLGEAPKLQNARRKAIAGVGCDPIVLFTRCRRPEYVDARLEIWSHMDRHGLSQSQIARACGMTCHSTISNALDRMKRSEEVTP